MGRTVSRPREMVPTNLLTLMGHAIVGWKCADGFGVLLETNKVDLGFASNEVKKCPVEEGERVLLR